MSKLCRKRSRWPLGRPDEATQPARGPRIVPSNPFYKELLLLGPSQEDESPRLGVGIAVMSEGCDPSLASLEHSVDALSNEKETASEEGTQTNWTSTEGPSKPSTRTSRDCYLL